MASAKHTHAPEDLDLDTLSRDLNTAITNGVTEPGEFQALVAQILPLPESPSQWATGQLREALREIVRKKDYDHLKFLLSADSTLSSYAYSAYAVETAADTGDIHALEILLEAGWNVNESGENMRRRPLLRYYLSNTKVRQWLLEHGGDPNGQDHRFMTNLEAAAMQSDTTVVQDLLNHGGNPAEDDSLIIAATKSNVATSKLLLQYGAQINKPEKEGPVPGEPSRRGRTALHQCLMSAAVKGTDIVDLLLANGASPTAKDANGRTPMDLAREIAKQTGVGAIAIKLEQASEK